MSLEYDIVKKTTDEVFVENEINLKQFFSSFHKKKGDSLDFLTTRDGHKMLDLFYDIVLDKNKESYNKMTKSLDEGFPKSVIEAFIKHKTYSQIKSLIYKR